MSELDKLVSQIEERSKRLVERKSELDNENSKLKTQINELRALSEDQKKTINELTKKHQVCKIAKTIGSEENNKEAISQLNIYIKEIDRLHRFIEHLKNSDGRICNFSKYSRPCL